MKNKIIAAAIFAPFVFASDVCAQYAQYNPGTIVTNSNQPVIVPPTIINPPDYNASKKSCRESVIDLFLFTIRNTSGDCTQ